MAKLYRYWDSAAFIGWLAKEDDKQGQCGGVIKAAEAGKVVIVTSAWTIVEVLKLKGHTPLKADASQVIRAFFRHEWIVVRQVDRFTAEYAQDLHWNHGISTKDAVHVATALRARPRVNQLDTFDDGLIAKSGTIGDPPLVIGKPDLPEQLELDELAGEQLDFEPDEEGEGTIEGDDV